MKSVNKSAFICVLIMTTLSTVTAQTRRQPADLLVTGGTIVTMDQTRRIIDDGAISVVKGRIVAIGPRAEVESRYTSRQRINAGGKVITPGLINGHTHVPMVLFRGLADDIDLQEWLTKYIFPAEAKNVTEDLFRVGPVLGWPEMFAAARRLTATCITSKTRLPMRLRKQAFAVCWAKPSSTFRSLTIKRMRKAWLTSRSLSVIGRDTS